MYLDDLLPAFTKVKQQSKPPKWLQLGSIFGVGLGGPGSALRVPKSRKSPGVKSDFEAEPPGGFTGNTKCLFFAKKVERSEAN